MPHTHKKKFRNLKYRNESDITSKFKQKKRNVKSMMNQIVGGKNPVQNFVPSNLHNNGLLNNPVKLMIPSVESMNPSVELMNPSVIGTNTSFVKSNLKSNPFYAKKSTHVVENKNMYSFDTNYIMDQIKQRQLTDPMLMITPELITQILADKPKPMDSIKVDHKKQEELFSAFCDFD
jgi:hypothetical protein